MSTSASVSVATDAAVAQHSPRQVGASSSRSLIGEPTAAMIAARHEFETRKTAIAPEDDPFWELRGCKGDHLLPPPAPEVPIKPQRKLAEIIDTIAPLPQTSHLLTPTTATKLGSYTGSPTHTPLRVAAIPETSHLLTPTKATLLSEMQRSDSKDHSVHSRPSSTTKATSPSVIPGVTPVNVTSKLLEPTIAYLSTKRSKASVSPPEGVAAREAGWVNVAVSPPPRHPVEPPPPPRVAAPQFRHVSSKLLQPTASFKSSQWKKQQEEEEATRQKHEVANGVAQEHHVNGKYANVASRLHASTAAASAAQWKSQSASPENKNAAGKWIGNEKSAEAPRRKAKSLSPAAAPHPSKLQTPTAATVLSQRSKYKKVDPLDIKYKDQMKNKPRRNSGGGASTSVLHREHPVDPDELLVEATRLLQMQPAFMQVTVAMEKAQQERNEEDAVHTSHNVTAEENQNEMTFLTNATINTTFSDAGDAENEVLYDSDNTSDADNEERPLDATVLEAANLQTSNSAATVDDTEEALEAEDQVVAAENQRDVTEDQVVAAVDQEVAAKDEIDVTEDQEVAAKDERDVTEDQVVAAENQRDVTGDQVVAAVDQEVVAKDEIDVTEDQEVVAEDQRDVTEDQEVAAEDQRDVTEDQEVTAAEDQRRVTEDQEVTAAENQKDMTEDQEVAAEDQRDVAEDQEVTAEDQNDMAEDQEVVTEDQRDVAKDQEGAEEKEEDVSNDAYVRVGTVPDIMEKDAEPLSVDGVTDDLSVTAEAPLRDMVEA